MRGKRHGSRFARMFVISGWMILCAILASPAGAKWYSTESNIGEPVAVRVLESSGDRIVLDVEIGGFDADPVAIDGRTYYSISLPGESRLLDVGQPELPHVCRSVIIPDRGGMAVRLLDAEYEEYPDLPVAPSKGNLFRTEDPAMVPYTFGAAYGSTDWFPSAHAQGSSPYILRDYRGMTIEALPFQTRGSDGTLRVARRMVIEIVPGGPDMTNGIDRAGPPSMIVDAFEPIYRRQFVNFGMERYIPVGERGRMLIVCYQDFMGAIQPLVDWKLQEGIPTSVLDVSAIGNTTTAIKNAIQTEYNAGGLAFVLLVGDGAQITTFQAAGGSSDPSYALLAGTDKYRRSSSDAFRPRRWRKSRRRSPEPSPMKRLRRRGPCGMRRGSGVASTRGLETTESTTTSTSGISGPSCSTTATRWSTRSTIQPVPPRWSPVR